MKFSENIANIAEALSKFQGEISNPPKNKTVEIYSKKNNSTFSYKYADLADIVEAIRPMLTKNGLAFLQNSTQNNGIVSVYTILVHSSGEKIEFDPVDLKGSTDDPKAVGALITYARRYSLCSALGIASDEDTDTNTPRNEPKTTKQTQNNRNSKQPQGTAETEIKYASAQQMEAIGWKWKRLGKDPEKLNDQLIKGYGHLKITEVEATDFNMKLAEIIEKNQVKQEEQVEEPAEPLASQGQIKAICAIAGSKKLSNEDQKLYIKREFGKESRKDLTKAEAHQVLNTFSKASKEELAEIIGAYRLEEVAESQPETEEERKKKHFNRFAEAITGKEAV